MIAKKLVALILARDGQCVIASRHCTGEPTVADHRANRGMGGAGKRLDVAENLVAACGVCNGLKESDLRVARDCADRRLSLPRGRSTADDVAMCAATAVTFPDGSRWRLLPDGTREAVA